MKTVLRGDGHYCAAPVTHHVTLGQIVELLDRCHIEKALAYHIVAKEGEVTDGNNLLMEEIKGDDRFEPQWCALPHTFDEFMTPDELHKAMKAMRKTGHKVLAVSGGVSCNTGLRRQLQETCNRRRIELILPPNSLTTDNAAMIAFAGMLRAKAGDFSPLDTPVDPNLKLAGVQLRK